jgi:hypothetical protein
VVLGFPWVAFWILGVLLLKIRMGRVWRSRYRLVCFGREREGVAPMTPFTHLHVPDTWEKRAGDQQWLRETGRGNTCNMIATVFRSFRRQDG